LTQLLDEVIDVGYYRVMKEIIVSLYISREDYLSVYQGQVKDVVATASDGRVVRFPAAILKGVVGHEGIHGTFKIHFDANNKFDGITRIK
jgi:hypothetical protein